MSLTNKPYMKKDDKKILRYIIDTNSFYVLRGKNFWKQCAELFPERTPGSIHLRFRNYIIHNLEDAEYGLSFEEIQSIQSGFEDSAMSSQLRQKKGKEKNELKQQDKQILRRIIDTNSSSVLRGRSFWRQCVEEILPGRSSESLRDRFRNYLINNLEDEDYGLTPQEIEFIKTGYEESSRENKLKKIGGKEGLKEQDRKILRHIIATKSSTMLRGRTFWKQCVKEILPGRSFESLRERFKNYLINNLEDEDYGLTAQEIESIRTGYEESSRENQLKRKAEMDK